VYRVEASTVDAKILVIDDIGRIACLAAHALRLGNPAVTGPCDPPKTATCFLETFDVDILYDRNLSTARNIFQRGRHNGTCVESLRSLFSKLSTPDLS
jgi:hypothetical protein